MVEQQQQEEDIWGQILRESSNKNNYFEKRDVAILGDPTSGKSLLLSKFDTVSNVESLKSIALSYTFSDIYEDDTSEDPVGRINYWSLEGEASQNDLLKFSLNKENIKNCMVIITLDFSQPWNLVESLKKWLGILEEHIKSIFKDDKNGFKNLQDKLSIKWHEYEEPTTTAATTTTTTTSNNIENNTNKTSPTTDKIQTNNVQKKKKKKVNISSAEDASVLPPLSENILINNLGVPILVACCKSDSVVMLEKDFDYKDELFDYIQQYLRRICLQYGAGLIYTSARKEINCGVTLEYIENILFGFELKSKTQLIEKDQIFVPAGWDTLAKIQVDFENQKVCKDTDEPYENIVKKPSIIKRREQTQTNSIICDDDQDFLGKIKSQLDNDDQSSINSPSTPSPLSQSSNNNNSNNNINNTSTPSINTPLQPTDKPLSDIKSSNNPVAASPSAERAALANFFTSLISKDKTSSRKDLKSSLASPPTTSVSSNAREDAKKELDKLKQQKK
ncbi:dynein light intermediate chain [Dictyostelium discoideum AX4]|uniref:Cytoplasmic dynein 1 light intermediate chain 1 n=1 Tax=Dictyostelium discoideum TaxID=44689 RepID=DC1L1_DICDI|nr:dynein light intermediate chain [Dictyostelium discoideum AX4]Q54CI8.1 RecName: Full=Cytoplasmic dynein 1 light intermediate chain 1; AltName: Full=Dynein light intermediate chain 1, cytosolic [Dictyostelium discoideum]EAL61001.1 dynein light intermediate chain [Dictyostelium discoideum AX4]|eukprot:XP_629428.1 dynein light intermediate chain [Dictyostelium discoideum AX4]